RRRIGVGAEALVEPEVPPLVQQPDVVAGEEAGAVLRHPSNLRYRARPVRTESRRNPSARARGKAAAGACQRPFPSTARGVFRRASLPRPSTSWSGATTVSATDSKAARRSPRANPASSLPV